MDIRTNLVFTLVSVSLASMLLLGVVTYRTVDTELREQTLGQLEGLADLKSDAVGGIIDGWHDRVSLVASRTQLRASLEEYNRTGGADAAERMRRILGDAVTASPLFRQLVLYDVTGRFVAGAGASGAVGSGVDEPDSLEVVRGRPAGTGLDDRSTRFEGLTFENGRLPTVHFSATLALGGAGLGTLHARLSTDEIERLAANHRGLGTTGETLIVAMDGETPRVLHPVGNGAAGLAVGSDTAVARALDGDSAQSEGAVLDYRGQAVWAATRLVGETDWGVVVKVDAVEQAAPVEEFRTSMVRLAISLAAFSVLFGTILGFRFAQPIHLLADTASRIGAGDLSARSGVEREDEVGLLARTFDGMAADLEEQVGLLTEFRRFFDLSIDMLCIASTDGYFKRVNPAFVRELGWTEEELLEKPFISLVHPDDLEATMREVERLAGGSPTIRFENRFMCADGSFKPLRWNSYPEEGTGRLYAIARLRTPKPEDTI
jgi:PAS domain S-box-containing protein